MQVVLGLHLQSDRIIGIASTPDGGGARRFVFPATIVWPQAGVARFTDDPASDAAYHGHLDGLDDPVPMHNLAGVGRGRAELCCATVSLAITEVERCTGDEVVRTVVALPGHWSPRAVETFRRALARRPQSRPVALAPETDATLGRIGRLGQSAGADSVLVADVGTSSTTLIRAVRPAGSTGFVVDGTTVLDGRGTAEIDHAWFTRVLSTLDAETRRAVQLTTLRTNCTTARTLLCRTVSTEIPLNLRTPSAVSRRPVRVVRSEIEELTRPWVSALVDALDRHARDGSRRPARVVLIGAASTIPLLVEQVSSHFRVPVIVPDAPDFVCAEGAATMAARDCVVRLPAPPRLVRPAVGVAAPAPARFVPARPAPAQPLRPARQPAPSAVLPVSTKAAAHPSLRRRRWPVFASAAAFVVLAAGAAIGVVSVDGTPAPHYTSTAHVSRTFDAGSATTSAGRHTDRS